MEEDNEFLKLPVEERCQHKLWKARVNGYEEATRLFQNQRDEKSPEFSKYLGLVKKFIIDNNALAQEKGLAAVLAYVENAAVAGKTCGEVMNGIVTKCLGAPKAKTKELALEIIFMYIEIEKHDIVQEELMKGLENKSPKVVASCTLALREALHLFGMQVVSIKPLVKVIPKLLEDRDKGIREEAKLLCVEVYRWIRDAIKPQLQSLKPVQLTELESDFEKVGNEKPIPVRYLRSQQEAQAKQALEARGEDDEVDCAPPPEIDAYDIMDSVDILSKLPKDFFEHCEAKKWQERKEALETLHQMTINVKLETGDYGELVRVLKKMVGKDTNVLVVSLAGKCLAGLARGLRKKFQPYSGHCVPVIFEKFKEKKQNVVQALREAIDAIYLTTTMEAILEDIQAALDNKNPQVKSETALFLARYFSQSTSPPNKKLLKPLCNYLVKTLNDTDSAVRDNSAEALGTALKVVGDKVMGPFLQEVDAIKMAKVKDCCEKAVVQVVQSSSSRNRATAAPAKSSVEVSSVESSKVPNMITKKTSSAPVISTKSKAVPSKSTRKPASGIAVSTKKVANEVQVEEFTERELSDEEVLAQIESLLPSEVLNGIGSANWKERLDAVEKFLECVNQIDKTLLPAQAFIRILAKKPGLKENNFQILKLKFEILTHIAENAPISHCAVECCLSDLVDKIGDPKTGASAGTALTALAEATSLEYISQEVLTLAFTQKNPRNQAEALIWLSSAVKEFGLKIQLKEVINKIKKAFSSTNPSVRTSALALLATLYLYVGKTLRTFFDGEKPALLQQIDAELDKVRDSKPPLPVRGLGAKCNSVLPNESNIVPSVNLADIVPRVDINSQISSSLLTEMSDKNWKVREEAIQKFASIIAEAKFILPNLGELPSVLRNRLTDTNKNLAIQALSLCQAIGTALGPHSNKHIRTLAPGMLAALGDNKANIRNAALVCLNTWMEHCSMAMLFEGETVSTALRSDNPYLRIELLGWCAEKLPEVTSLPTAELILCIPSLLACLEDRNNDVRKKAHDSLLPFMTHVGYEQMARVANKLKPASKNTVMAHLEKIRPNLPERATTRPKSGAMKGVSSVVASPPSPNAAGENLGVECVGTGTGKGKLNRSASKSKLTLKAGGSTSSKGSKKEEEVDTSPPLVVNNLKDQRLNDERALKVLRWNFTSPREEFYLQLKEQMATANWGRTLVTYCFHNDFKLHLKSIDILNECLSSNLDATAANLDLILKWLALRFFDTNPSVLIRGLEYLQQLFEALVNYGYRLLEAEASSFVPYLILKMGDPKDAVRKGVREILKLMCNVYPFTKIFSYVMQGLASKNARQRAECLEELGLMIEKYGLSVYQPSPAAALRDVAKQISDRDNSVRNAALNCFVQAYFLEGEKIYKYVGQLADKDMSLLEERIKRSSKGRIVGHRDAQKETSAPSPQASRSPPSGNADSGEVIRRATPKGCIPRPRSTGPLTLEVDDIEHMFKRKESETKIPEPVEVNADEILNLPDIQLPQTRLRPPASAVKLLNNSAEANTALNLVMAQLTAQEIPVVVEAFAQIEEVLRQDDKAETVLGSRVDQLLVMGALQYRLAHNKHMADENICKAEVIRLYRCVTMALLSLFDHNTLAKQASRDVLRDLIPHLVTVMLDTRLNELQEGPQVVRAINILIVRILQRSNPTHVMSALIKLLHDCVGSMNTSERFTELVMKCLWKMLRMMGQYINELNVDRILLDLHVFLKAYPSSSWRDRPSDTPIRTVKTILYTLVSYKGEDIMKHLMLIPNRQDSDLVCYLQKLLHVRRDGDKRLAKGSSGISSKGQNHDDNIPDTGTGSRKGKNSPLKLSKSTHEALTEIFRKIGAKEHTKEGLMELYEFKQRHPEANIEPFLKRSSEFFQNYISEGIKAIELEKSAQEQHSLPYNISSPQLLDVNSKSDSRLINQGSLEITQSNKDFEKTISSTWTQGLPPIPPYSEETTTMDWIEWLKIVVAHLGMDTTQYNDAAFLQQLLSNSNIRTDDNAAFTEQEMAAIFKDVEKLQCMLENIKQQYKMSVK